MSKAVRTGAECPYLDTISRQNLEFDFEKCCSVSLSPVNVYACLVCGKFFQVYCLPDMYQVVDRSLADIQYILNPTYTEAEISRLDTDVTWARALDGSEYMPGLVGLNNMKRNDYANVVVQALVRIGPIRDFFLREENYAGCTSTLVREFASLVRKLWLPRAFKGHVSPHEFMQAVIGASKRRFTIDCQADAIEFFQWLVNALHLDLTGGRHRRRSIVSDCLRGELEVTTLAGTGRARDRAADLVERVPFLMLGLDLPPAPLFKDALENVVIPQVPMRELLAKYGGERVLPAGEASAAAKYNLIANIVHEGKHEDGTLRVHILRKVENTWYDVQDLRVTDVLPQMVALSETYMQIYERQ
ncbi:hypothetical protein QBZ16_000483 [Prototheca wickerhamii]|uniref:USP domain-containing protein n=1 Tax=Prototheca wickerhamii TaxID=3111 RepID=A0AAD9IL86_PROWI|nr:hypothetical protein QBZ16_000483 [Prototheca wickerhamii]